MAILVNSILVRNNIYNEKRIQLYESKRDEEREKGCKKIYKT